MGRKTRVSVCIWAQNQGIVYFRFENKKQMNPSSNPNTNWYENVRNFIEKRTYEMRTKVCRQNLPMTQDGRNSESLDFNTCANLNEKKNDQDK